MKLASLVILTVLVTAGSALAQNPSDSGAAPSTDARAARVAVRQACRSEIGSYCSDKRGREAMMCLRANADKLSAPCKDALSKMPQRPPRLRVR